MTFNSDAGISWLIEQQICRDDLSASDKAKQSSLIADTFYKNKDVLDYESNPLFEDVLISSGDLQITIGNGLNAILNDYFSGGGMLYPEHTKHLIMLLLLQKNAVTEGVHTWITLCNTKGHLIEYDSINELCHLLEPLGFNKDELRSHAEAVGLCEQAINLSALDGVEQEDYFF